MHGDARQRLGALLGAEYVDYFVYMGEVVIRRGIHEYKHRGTGHYLYLSEDGRAWTLRSRDTEDAVAIARAWQPPTPASPLSGCGGGSRDANPEAKEHPWVGNRSPEGLFEAP